MLNYSDNYKCHIVITCKKMHDLEDSESSNAYYIDIEKLLIDTLCETIL